jgi:hypothetical protein
LASAALLSGTLNQDRAMQTPDYAIGQAVYLRTDSPDYEEVTVPFKTLGELVEICSTPRPDLVLDKVVVYAMPGGEPRAVTLGFLSASRGSRPENLDQFLQGQ